MRRVLVVATALSASNASAEPWLTAETPAALAMSDAHEAAFRPGVMPAVGLYLGRDHLAVGVRGRFGVLRNGPAPGGNLADPGVGGLGTLGLAIRATVGRTWFEVVGGGGVTGGDLVPTLEAGVGWMLDVGAVEVGPSIRYMRVVSTGAMDTLGTADLALVGIDFRFGAHRAKVMALPVAAAVPDPVVVEVVAPPTDDRDTVVDTETSCATDLDGCQIAPDVFMVDHRIVLPDLIMFDFNAARVRSRGREAIGHIADAWHAHREWTHITVEGHADVRGSDEYNQWLSQLRADRARMVLLHHGFAADSVDAIGYGRSRPRDTGTDEAAHARNRRVEFVIVTSGVTP